MLEKVIKDFEKTKRFAEKQYGTKDVKIIKAYNKTEQTYYFIYETNSRGTNYEHKL